MSSNIIYLIWSNEHRSWWAAPSGYTSSMEDARRFSQAEALRICLNAIPGTASRMGLLPELPVPFADAWTLRTLYLTDYPEDGADWA